MESERDRERNWGCKYDKNHNRLYQNQPNQLNIFVSFALKVIHSVLRLVLCFAFAFAFAGLCMICLQILRVFINSNLMFLKKRLILNYIYDSKVHSFSENWSPSCRKIHKIDWYLLDSYLFGCLLYVSSQYVSITSSKAISEFSVCSQVESSKRYSDIGKREISNNCWHTKASRKKLHGSIQIF